MRTPRSHHIAGAGPGDSLAGPPVPGARSAAAALPAWHAEPAGEVLSRLGSAMPGLTEIEATRRLVAFGPNQLARIAQKSGLAILWSQFQSVVVALLIAAMGVAVVAGAYVDAAAVLAVLIINTGIGFATEWRARRAMDALLQFDVPRAVVIRDGVLRVVPAHLLVVGDLIELNPGQHVPADARLLETSDLRTSEATLTGESAPVSKHAHADVPPDAPVADRVTMVYKGTTVAAGMARAVITATGASTEVGRIGTLVAGLHDEPTPLERRLDALGRRLVWLALGVAAAISGLNAWHGAPLAAVIETGLALAVAAVPEALPAVATIALAIGVRRMARRHALVRRLPAVEALGSATVVCTDKTRTLTSGDMSVVHVWTAGTTYYLAPEADGLEDTHLRVALGTAALASRVQAEEDDGDGYQGDPIDVAVLRAVVRLGERHDELVRRHPVTAWIPFSTERKFMAAFHRTDLGLTASVKGAPRHILAMSSHVYDETGERALDDDQRRRLMEVNFAMAAAGLRVLAVARGAVSTTDASALQALTFVAFLGLLDPPADGVHATIQRLRAAGLRTVMLTGDQRKTAEAIGHRLGTLDGNAQVMDGRDLEGLSDDELRLRVLSVGAFSRVSPEHKLRIVRALQARGEIVAMLGDGVNDAAALRQADIGVAMGLRGTDVAREAAAIVLQDDRFDTIAAAVEEGRVVGDNIRKFVFYLFSCNTAEVLVLLVAGLAGWPAPLQPLQVLWLNLITDTFPALALALEPADQDVMSRPPRDPRETLLSWAFLRSVGAYAVLITLPVIAVFVWGLADPARAMTMSFMTLALAQIFHLGNARSQQPVLHPRRIIANGYALGSVLLALGLQVAAMYVEPLPTILGVHRLTLTEWGIVGLASVVPAVVGQGAKLIRRR
jgi:Ca2+-transporting ATPase